MDARGGGRDSNVCAALALAQLGAEALVLAGPSARSALSSRLHNWLASPDVSPSAPPDGSLGYALALALLTQSSAAWRASRPAFLAASAAAAEADRGAVAAAARGNGAGPSSSVGVTLARSASSSSDDVLWEACRPWLTWVGLFDQLQRIAKPPACAGTPPAARVRGLAIPGAAASPPPAPPPPPPVASGADADDVSPLVITRLRDLPEALGRAREMVTYLEDALSAADVDEGLEALDMLSDVAALGLEPPPESNADWLRRASAGEGKSARG